MLMDEVVLGKVAPTPRGQYDPEKDYEKLDIIQHEGSAYMVLKDCKGETPTEGEFYMLLVSKGDTGPAGVDGASGADGAPGADGVANSLGISVEEVAQLMEGGADNAE